MMDRAEFLGLIMKGHKYNVTVSGTHGKTTTTSMISFLIDADVDPTILVGGELDQLEEMSHWYSDYFCSRSLI